MKKTLKVAGAVVAFLLFLAIAASFLVNANQFRPELESKLTQALGRTVKLGNLKLRLLYGRVTADDLSIADDPAFSAAPFVQAKWFSVGVNLPVLIFSRKISVTSLVIEQPEIRLLQSAAGDWNFSTMGTKSRGNPAATASPAKGTSKLDLSVKLVRIAGGRFTLGRAGRSKPLVLEKVDAELHDFAATDAFPFSLDMTVAGGGAIHLDGKAGPIDETDLALTPATIRLQVDKLDLAGSGLNEIAPDVAGLVSLNGRGQTSGSAVDVKGRLKIDKLKLSPKGTPAKRTLELDFHVTDDLRKRTGVIHQADVHFGTAITRIDGTYASQGGTVLVDMNIAGPNMPVQELTEILPALGIVLPKGTSLQGGTAGVTATIVGPLDRLVSTGSLTLNDSKLAGFNLSSRLSGIEKLAGIKSGIDTEIREFSGHVKVAPDGITADTIKLLLPAVGDLAGGGTVDPENKLNFKMQATVHTTGLAKIASNEPVPFTVDGTCAEPLFHPDLAGIVKQEVKGVGKAAGGLLKGLLGGK